jgi:hypothetical protein
MCCRTTIETAAREIRARGLPEEMVLRVGTVIYGLHHPDVPPHQALNEVAAWTREAVH